MGTWPTPAQGLGIGWSSSPVPDEAMDHRNPPAPHQHTVWPPSNGANRNTAEMAAPPFAADQGSVQPPESPVKVRRSRASRACENCRKRKVRCSGGEVCNECQRFGEKCVYREHYRAKREFAVKILRTPDFDKDLKRTESSLDGTVAAPERAASIGGSITATGGSSDGAFDECVVQTKVRHFATRIQEIFPEEHDSPLWAPFKIGLKLAIQAPLAIFQRAR